LVTCLRRIRIAVGTQVSVLKIQMNRF